MELSRYKHIIENENQNKITVIVNRANDDNFFRQQIEKTENTGIWRRLCEKLHINQFIWLPIIGTIRTYRTHTYHSKNDHIDHSKEASSISLSTQWERLKGTFLDSRFNFSGRTIEQLPGIDIVLISHNHRDHVDEATLHKLLPQQPIMIVPEGDCGMFTKMGFTNVYEVLPGDSITLPKQQASIHIANTKHWSGRKNLFK